MKALTTRPRLSGESPAARMVMAAFDMVLLLLFWVRFPLSLAGKSGWAAGEAGRGPEGLYCNGLYDLNAELLSQLGPAIELGRSFVATDYQRDGASLLLLWRGIGELVGRNPQYTTLFGAVSMTDSYRPLSKLLMMEYLGARKAHGSLWGKVRARVAPKIELGRRLTSLVVGAALPSLEDVSALVSSIEPDGKGAPTLLKHYLRLNGLIASFGIDQGFNDALDGFVVVDLLKTDRRLLKKYLGA